MFGSLRASGWVGFGAGFLVASVMGAIVFWGWGARDVQEAPAPAFRSALSECEPDEVAAKASEGDGALEACRDTLATVRASHEEALKTFKEHEDLTEYLGGLIEEMSPDRPVAFPDELDEIYQPEGFRA